MNVPTNNARKNVIRFYRMIVMALLLLPALSRASEHSAFLLSIDDAVRIGVTNHYALKLYQYKDTAFDKMIYEYWREYLPTLGLSYQRQNQVLQDTTDTRRQEIQIQLEQMIYDGGQRGLNLDVAKLQKVLNDDEFKITYNQLRFNIQKTYIQTIAAKGKVRLNEKSLKRALIQLSEIQRENSLGFSTKLQVMSVASKVEEIRLALNTARAEYTQNTDQLKVLLNLKHHVQLELKGNIFYDFQIRQLSESAEALIQYAIRNRSEAVKAATNLMIKQKQQEIAEYYWIPKIYVGSYYTRAGEENPFQERSWGVNFRVTMPIGGNTTSTTVSTGGTNSIARNQESAQSGIQVLDSMSTSRTLLESRIATAEAADEQSRMRETIAIEILQGINNLNQAREAISIGCNRTYYQYKSLLLMTSKYAVGEVKRSDIVSAEVDLIEAQESLTDALAGYLVYAYQLESASGLPSRSLNLFNLTENGTVSIFSQMMNPNAMKETKPAFDNKVPENIDKEILPDSFLLDDIQLYDEKK